MTSETLVCGSDKALATSDQSKVLFLSGGDVAQSIGRPGQPGLGESCTEVTIDAMRCTISVHAGPAREMRAASSIIIGHRWSGRHVVVSNAGWIGHANIAPRAHPNDGIVEVISFDKDMSFRQRLQAWRKSRTGTHLPHPAIHVHRVSTTTIDRLGREKLSIDGETITGWTSISIQVVPDYWRVLV